MARRAIDPMGRLPVVEAANAPGKALELEADAVVVGSGAGGAVMAYELARAGRSVVLLEAGPYVPSTEFTERYPEMLAKLYVDGAGQTNADGDLIVLQGSCLGGSTVVNAAVAFRTPGHILHHWQQEFGLSNLSPDHLAPYFERVEENVGVHVNAPHEINRNSQLLTKGTDKLGYSSRPVARNIKNCALTGFCLAGCASDRKQSMLVTYVPWAMAHGAEVLTDTFVDEIRVEGGRARGVRGTMRDREGRHVATVDVRAKAVVLAAGAIQTPILLQKNGLADSSKLVGGNFACHPSIGILARFPDKLHGWQGATVGAYCDEFEHPDKGGFIFEYAMAGPDFMATMAPGLGRTHVEFMRELDRTAGMISLIHDHNVGRVGLTKDGKKRIDYALSAKDKPVIRECLKRGSEIMLAAGAEEVILPLNSPTFVRKMEDIDRIVDGLTLDPQTLKMTSYHPQGTCRMGADPARSVVRPDGRTHDVEGLYVADASLFPSSIMVNPQVTIYALSTYLAEQMLNDDRTFR